MTGKRDEGWWHEVKGRIRNEWTQLTEDDLQAVERKRAELAMRIQDRYGLARIEAIRLIDSFTRRNRDLSFLL